MRRECSLASIIIVLSAHCAYGQVASFSDDIAFFEREVRPIFVENCYECHSANAKKLQAGLRLDHIDLIRKGGDSGPAIVDQDRDSVLLQAVRHESFEMPPKGKLSAEQIAIL